jgi:zinc protease
MKFPAFRARLARLLLTVAAVLTARSAHASPPALTDSLRLDPLVRTGTLPNGMRWFIRRNPRPEARISLRLAVAVGSIAETDAQRGLAHFTEHMNFDGSKHFAPQELVAYLESIGMRFGYDANAYTSFDETVYMLEVPTDRDTLLDRGLTALADFAGAALFDTAQVRKERGVVVEEWRLGRGAAERMFRKTIPAIYHGSRYAVRDPIGKPEVIRGTPTRRIRDFYDRWYTPDRMAVVAVGDVDPARLDSLIRVHFAGLGRAAPPAKSAPVPIPLHPQTLVSIATDPEATWSSVELLFKHPRRSLHTVADYRRALAEQLYEAMLDERFNDLAHRPDPPFLGASTSSNELGRTLDAFAVSASVNDGGLARGLEALIHEVQRVRRFGFLPAELERARENLRQQDASRYAERGKQESERLAARYVDVFLTDEPSIGAEKGHELVGALLDGITLADVQALTPQLIHDDSRVVVLYAPAKKGVSVPTEAQVRQILTRASATTVTAWREDVTGRALMERPPAPGTIVGRRELAPLGVTVLRLSNGAEVWLKPTDFKADEIQIGGEALGGLSLADSTDYLPAWSAGWVVSQLGVGGLNSTALQKVLTGKLVSMQSWVGRYTHGVSGRARPSDLETALQLLHLQFTAPTPDTTDFANTMRNAERWYANRRNDPDLVFADTVDVVNSGDFWMSRPIDPRGIARLRLERVLAEHRRLYANAADFTFYMVGAFQVDSIAPLLARYLGALPSSGRATSAFLPRGPHEPAGVRTVRVRRASEPKSQTVITFFTASPIEELDMHRARACASILQERLRRRLRERMGGTYGASVGFSNMAPVPGHASMAIEFGCEPGRVDSMVAASLAEVARLRDDGPSAGELGSEQEIERRELEVSEKENGTWLSLLSNFNAFGWDPLRIAKRRERIGALTPEGIRGTAVKYFPPDRYTVISLLPRTP